MSAKGFITEHLLIKCVWGCACTELAPTGRPPPLCIGAALVPLPHGMGALKEVYRGREGGASLSTPKPVLRGCGLTKWGPYARRLGRPADQWTPVWEAAPGRRRRRRRQSSFWGGSKGVGGWGLPPPPPPLWCAESLEVPKKRLLQS